MAELPSRAARLVAITDVAQFGMARTEAALATLCRVSRAGSVIVQCRDRELSARERLAWARRLRALTSAHDQHLLVNDRLDLALLSAADGVHLGEASISPRDVRGNANPAIARLCVSVAWHELERAPDPTAELALVSPVMQPRKGRAALGPRGLSDFVVRAERCAVYALGGVGPQHCAELLALGASGVAAVGAVIEHPRELAAALGIVAQR